MVFISSRTFSNGGGIGRRELCLRTGEQQHQAYYRRGGVLIIDNFAHSSRAAAIICFAFVTTLRDRPPASMSIRNVVSSVFRTALSAFCLLHPLQYSVHSTRGCHSSRPQLHLPPSSVEKHLLSDSSHCALESQHRLHVCTHLPPGAQKRSSVSFAVDNSLHCDWSSFRERNRHTPPFVLSCGERQDIIVVTADLRGVPPG